MIGYDPSSADLMVDVIAGGHDIRYESISGWLEDMDG